MTQKDRELVRERSQFLSHYRWLQKAGVVELGRQLKIRELERIGHGAGPIREREQQQMVVAL